MGGGGGETEGKRAVFALPGDGSGTNSLGRLAESPGSYRNRLDGEHGGAPSVNIFFISLPKSEPRTAVQEHVCLMEICVCLETDLFANIKGEMWYDIQLKSRLHLPRVITDTLDAQNKGTLGYL